MFFLIGINCGLRISDILNLNVEDVKNKTHISIIEKKTGKRKRFPLNKKLKPLLDKFTLKRNNCYRAISPMWDNTSRRKNNSTVFDGATPQLYKQWLIDIIKETKANQTIADKFIFINAWNEWAEGTYLEPDEKYGYANINTLSKAIFDISLDK